MQRCQKFSCHEFMEITSLRDAVIEVDDEMNKPPPVADIDHKHLSLAS